jgi:hypothetical protein
VARLYRLRRCGDWLAVLVGRALAATAPQESRGRLIRIIGATTVPKAGMLAKTKNRLRRVHRVFDLPGERFGVFELTDQHGGEVLDRIPVVTGEIRIADRAYLQPDPMATVVDAGADLVVRAGWRNARWLDAEGEPVDLLAEFGVAAASGLIDRPIWIGRKSGAPGGSQRRAPNLEGHTRRRRMDDPDHLAQTRGLSNGRCPRPLSPALAHRARLQAPQESGRFEETAGQRRAFRQTLRPGSSSDDPVARTARRRVRGLSPLGCRRLTQPAAWRLVRQLVATLRQAIIPEPTIACLQRRATTRQRHLPEPPRRQSYQKLSRLF